MRRDFVREVLLAAVFFGSLAALAWREGVIEKLGSTAVALGLFGLAFAAFTAWLDRDLRAALTPRRRSLRSAPAKSPAAKRAAT